MIMLAITCLLAGMALGQRFTVLVLVPTIALILILIVCAHTTTADGLWWTILKAVAGATSLQIGYVAGIGIRRLQAPSRAGAKQSVPRMDPNAA
jgi:hypothetical protein